MFRLQCAIIVFVGAFFLLRAELFTKFGDSPLRPPGYDVEHSRHLRVINHGQVVMVEREGRLVVTPLCEAGVGMDDPSVVGAVDLIASWAAPQDGVWPPVVVERRLGVKVTSERGLESRARAEAIGQFLVLLESWGHGRLARIIGSGEGDATLPRWAGMWAHARGWGVLVVFVGALGAVVVLGGGVAWATWRRWLTTGGRRDARLRRGVCPGCGYSREGLGGGVCPECGEGW